MTKAEFKKWWEGLKDDDTYSMDTFAQAAVDWGISSRPKIRPMDLIQYQVLTAAGTNDAEDHRPSDEDEEDY